MKEDLTPLQVVEEINELLYTKQEKLDMIYQLSLVTNGNIEFIEFQDEMLWNSDNDERGYIGTTDVIEPLLPFVKKQLNKYIDKISKLKVR